MAKPRIKDFYSYARKRHEIYLKKQSDPSWITKDPILYKYRFTNVFRELDKTTEWFRKHVRDPLDESPDVLLATVTFRMLNRIEVGEAIFNQRDLFLGKTAFELFTKTGNVDRLRQAIKTSLPNGPYATGAYIISSPPGYSKLDGILSVIGGFAEGAQEWEGLGAGVMGTMNWSGEEGAAAYMRANHGDVTLQATFEWLRKFPYLGVFHSYEIVTDLRHTYLLREAPDIDTWANVGPGAARGLNRVFGREISDEGKRAGQKVPTERMLEEMQEILTYARLEAFWPQRKKGWPAWELRDVEHTLCEFDKYERVRLGQGRPRGVYR